MAYTIVKKLVSGLPKKPYRKGASAYEGVVSHATANYAPAVNEISFMSRNFNNAFVHYFVDWTGIFQTADTAYKAFGAGPVANERYVHVELCQTKDKEQFKKSYDYYTYILAYVLYQKKLGVTSNKTLLSHDWISKNLGGTTHSDPIGYLKENGITWDEHVNNVADQYKKLSEPKPIAAPVKSTIYRVQVGAFSKQDNAEALRDKLKKAGFDAIVVKG